MYFKPPQNNLTSPFYHPLNEKLNEERQFKARIAFMGKPKDNARDMRAAARMGMYDAATERDVPSKRKSTVFDITFKSERQFNQFMGAYDVEFLDRLDEAVKTKVEKTSQGFQVMVYSPKVKKFIPQGSPHKTKAEAEKDAKMFEDVEIDESRDDFDYLDAQAASEDRAIAGKKFMDALKKAGIKAEYVSSSGTMRVAKKDLRKAQGIGKKLKVDRDGVRMDVLREDVQLDEVTGETTVMAKSDRNQYERITRALTAANRTGKIKGYEGAHFNERTGMLTLIFDSKAHKPASQRRMVAKMIKDFGLEFSHSVEEGFASDAQRRAAFASGYKAKGKKKKKEGEEVEEGLRQAMSGPKETAAQKQKRQEKDNFDLYKKRQKRLSALRGDRSSRELTPKQQRDYLKRVNLDQIRAMEEVEVDEAKGTYSSMSRRGIEKPLMAFIADLEDELKKVGIKYSDRKVDPDDVMKAYNADMSPKDAAAMIKKKA